MYCIGTGNTPSKRLDVNGVAKERGWGQCPSLCQASTRDFKLKELLTMQKKGNASGERAKIVWVTPSRMSENVLSTINVCFDASSSLAYSPKMPLKPSSHYTN